MKRNEYFSNCYRSLITNKAFHLFSLFIEYLLTLVVQFVVFKRGFISLPIEKITINNFFLSFEKLVDIMSLSSKIIIMLIILISGPIYYIVFNKFLFKKKSLKSIILINIYEIFFFRLVFILLCHISFSVKGIFLIINIILTVPAIGIVIDSFLLNHLYYFSPKFIIYPYDYYTEINDIFHLFEKC